MQLRAPSAEVSIGLKRLLADRLSISDALSRDFGLSASEFGLELFVCRAVSAKKVFESDQTTRCHLVVTGERRRNNIGQRRFACDFLRGHFHFASPDFDRSRSATRW